jgi:hypothetical protein
MRRTHIRQAYLTKGRKASIRLRIKRGRDNMDN